ncbi:hypothetical protein EBR57_00750, partial [bacterium]|nr:hypothetical protein [bacterium]
GQVAKLDSPAVATQLSDIGVSGSQLREIKGELVQKTCDAIGSNHHVSSLSSSEIKAEQVAVRTLDASGTHSAGALKNLARMDHAAENIGPQRFDKLTSANKDLTLQIYQHGGLSETNGYDTAFMQKLGQCSDQFHTDKGLNDFVELAFKGDSQITQYQALRTIADTQLPAAPGRAESPIVAEHTLVAIGQASEKAALVKPGATEAQHRLHHATKALVGEINSEGKMASPLNSLASVKFTAETVSAIKQHVTIRNVDHLLAQIITLQNRLLDGEALVPPRSESGRSEPLPVSQKTKDQLVACGLTTADKVDTFVQDAQLGVKNSKHFEQIVGRLEEFSKTISSNAALKDAFNNTFDNSLSNALAGHNSVLQARAADTGDRTVADRFTGAAHKLDKVTAGIATDIRTVVSKNAQTTERAASKLESLQQVKAAMDTLQDFALGQQVGGKTVTHEHLQLWQNKQLMADELSLASKLSNIYRATGSSVTVDHTTSKIIDDEITIKLAFVAGEKGYVSSDANKFAKAGLMPGRIEAYTTESGTEKLRYVKLTRSDDGSIQSTVVGDLSKQQAERYLGTGAGSLQKADRTHSATTDAVTQRAVETGKSANDADLNSFLAAIQSKTVAPGGDGRETVGQRLTRAMEKLAKDGDGAIAKDAARLTQIAAREGVTTTTQRTMQGAINTEIGKILSDVQQTATSALSDSQKVELVQTELSKPEVQDAIQQAVNDSLTKAGTPITAATTAMSKSLITQFAADITGTLKGLASEVHITSSQKKDVEAKQAGVAFESAHESLTSVMSDMESGSSRAIGLNTFIQADAGGMIGMFDVSASLRGDSEDKMTIANSGGKFSITVTQGKSVSGDVSGGFLSTLSASLGGSVGGERGLTFNFETPSDAAGFLAAIKQGNAKLALAYTQDSPETSKATQVSGRGSAGIDVGGAIGLGGVLTAGGAIEFGHKSSTVQGNDSGAKWTETAITSSRKYETDISALGTSVDSRSMETSRSVTQRTSGEPQTAGKTQGQVVLAYSEEETLSFTSNGNQLSASGKSLGEERLAVLVNMGDIDKVVQQRSQFQGTGPLSGAAELAEFKTALQNFDPGSQKIVITETLKPDVLSKLDPSREDSRKEILSNPRNFTQTISIVSIDSSESSRSISAQGLTVGQTATGTSESIVKSITIGQSLSIDRLKMADSVDVPDVISAPRSQSANAL